MVKPKCVDFAAQSADYSLNCAYSIIVDVLCQYV